MPRRRVVEPLPGFEYTTSTRTRLRASPSPAGGSSSSARAPRLSIDSASTNSFLFSTLTGRITRGSPLSVHNTSLPSTTRPLLELVTPVVGSEVPEG